MESLHLEISWAQFHEYITGENQKAREEGDGTKMSKIRRKFSDEFQDDECL